MVLNQECGSGHINTILEHTTLERSHFSSVRHLIPVLQVPMQVNGLPIRVLNGQVRERLLCLLVIMTNECGQIWQCYESRRYCRLC